MHSKNLQCFYCKEYGHIAATCSKKFCSYCKKKGHIIKECRIRPQNRQAQAFQTSIIVPPIATSAAHDSSSAACSVPAPPAPDYCTLEMVQRMLISTLSAMGFQGNNSTKLWYVDSGASNHMTNNPTALCHVRPYAGQSSIQTANGSSLPIAAISDAYSKFTNVFLAPQLSMNLISVGQLVDNNCVVNFSGHPNTQILSHVLNFDLSGNKDRSSLSLECDSCKLGKSKTLFFPLHASRASHCFDFIHSDVWGPFLVFRTFIEFLAYVDNQFSTSIKTLRTDSDGEYLSTEFQSFLASKGIIHQHSCPSTQQNGVAECKTRHLLDMVRTLLLESYVPSMFWVEALKIATHLINRLPSQVLHMESPYFRLFAKQPSYDHLRIFGCVCFVHLPPHERQIICSICSMNVIFFENQHFFPISSSTVPSSSTVVLPSFEQQFSDLHPVSSRFQPVRRSPRVSVPPNRYGFPSSSSGNSISALIAALSNFDIPTCYSHAAKYDCWRQAMQEEIAALEANHTWDIELYPPTIVPLGCKRVYSVKVQSNGSLDRYKARLVALGNNQEYGVNYEETFASVVKMTIVRMILALIASNDWPLHKMDVKNAFLHGDLKECIYMKPPPGLFFLPTSHVCKLRRSLYELKQASRAWFDKFRTTLLQFSFSSKLISLSPFIRKNLGSLTYFLGLEVHHSPSGISLNQHKYTSDLVAITGLQGATFVDTPMELNVNLRKEEGDLLADPSLYRNQFLQTPRHLHLAAVRRIIRYVQGTSTRGLFFPAGNSTCLTAYSDADWVGCADTRRSIIELDFSETDPTPLHTDNTSAIQITTNPVYHERTKHIEVDCYSIREAFEAHVITLPHISTDLQIVDIFTKALPRHRHCLLSSKLMLVDQPASI
ncbi:Retrovirus-related Pol polyprotein from transposon TNT 1-94 [Vitis vinifera]|uniref:Retrovirus-related Pol polyprotein from transposon TNT 1-94 n=1 Tax=Vitis vinifera TaxID=29760 RepID=A0A438KNG8_VITVI|nr:Retrovirus-related Pol polyprotein from transposon TNT 1-94 [Vitis vinifera]